MQNWPNHPPLFLENVYEQTPMPLRDLLQGLTSRKAGICFDTGHWHSFSQGYKRHNLSEWLHVLSPYIRHLHLHDNDGSFDQHLGLGKGSIPWEQFFNTLHALHLRPTITFEPHSQENLEQSLAFIQAHQAWFH